MRARIDISEIEAQTKIRAKYLRALENEEWDLLPGPDVRQELPAHVRRGAGPRRQAARRRVQAAPRAPQRGRAAADQRRAAPASARAAPPGSRFPRVALVALVIVGLVVALYLLGRGADDSDEPPAAARPRRRRGRRRARRRTHRRPSAARPKPAAAADRGDGAVDVCLQAADGRTLVNGQTLQAGQRTSTLRSRRFRLDARQQRRRGCGSTAGRARSRRRRARSASRSRRGGKICRRSSPRATPAARMSASRARHRRHRHRGADGPRARPQRPVAVGAAARARRRPDRDRRRRRPAARTSAARCASWRRGLSR